MAFFAQSDVALLQRRFSAARKRQSSIRVPSARLFEHNLNHLNSELALFFKTWCSANPSEQAELLHGGVVPMVSQRMDHFERLVELNSRPVQLLQTRLSDFIQAARQEIPRRVPDGVLVQVKGPIRRLADYSAYLDSEALLEVLHEYVRNAAKANVRTGISSRLVVRIGLRTIGGRPHAFFQVTDRALGVPENRQERLFHVQTLVGNRPSLGLESIRELVESRHGGQVYYKTRPGAGSTFGFSIALEKRRTPRGG
ncbi:ATP-binding protein [Candidatus Micrarchaeota archaeon]|nr:ATP-binding protein [Candidatus Micrarchaeota archaeon]